MGPSNGATTVNFNSHAHVERDNINAGSVKECIDFNSHAHVERDTLHKFFRYYWLISTHTLTWSVTR